MSDNGHPGEVVYRIRRFDFEADPKPRWETYRLPYTPGMTVLDGLWALKETQAPDLSWRSSCRMGICGSCGMMINRLPRLACNTQISELGSPIVTIEPLPNFGVVRDLVPDLHPMFDSHGAMLPFIIREDKAEMEDPSREYGQTHGSMEEYLQFSYCIKCGCCIAACPTCATDPLYSGPMPLAQAHRYNADSRDGGFRERRVVLRGQAGPWRCHFAGECSRVCPKGVDPARAIQLLKRALVLDGLRLRRSRRPAGLVEKPEGIERRPDIPEAPPPTLKPSG